MTEVMLLVVIIVVGTTGEMFVSRAMKKVGEVKDFHPRAVLNTFGRAMRSPWMWGGVAMMAIAFFSLLGALSMANVSFVVPVTALNFVVGALGGIFFLGERIAAKRWIGVILVIAGVTMVVLGRR